MLLILTFVLNLAAVVVRSRMRRRFARRPIMTEPDASEVSQPAPLDWRPPRSPFVGSRCTTATSTPCSPVDLDLPEKHVTALIGPSGCGKSTFLRSLNRMNELIPGCRVVGDVRLDGEPIYGQDIDPVVVRRRIGMVFQRSNPFPKSIFENVAYGLRIGGVDEPSRDRRRGSSTR